MANIKSAQKRIRRSERSRLRNRDVMGLMRSAIKRARAAIDGKSADASTLVRQAISTVDKAVSKGVVPRRTASRYISRLTSRKPAA